MLDRVLMSEREVKAIVDLFLARASEARKERSAEKDAGRKLYLLGVVVGYEAAALELRMPK